MSVPVTIYHVDAFTKAPFKGNPAAVCIPEKDMPEDWMQNVAAEMNLSETSFIRPEGEDFRIRFFTPAAEIPLCGHATLSTAHILYETGICQTGKEIKLLSKAGELRIRKEGSWIIMNFPSYGLVQVEKAPVLGNILGMMPSEVYSTGHGWTLVLLEDEKAVRTLKPDFRMMKESGFGDMIVTAPSDDKDYDFCVRCFVPALGIDEDPVTGSAHCSLVPFWQGKTGRSEFVSHQVSKREGVLKVASRGDRVEVSGQAITILSGQLLI